MKTQRLHEAETIATALRERARALGLTPLEQLHRHTPAHAIQHAARLLVGACCEPDMRSLIDALALTVGRAHFGDVALVVQFRPVVRCLPPARGDLASPFHTDAWAGNRADQLNVWMPIVDVIGDEGLWIVDRDVSDKAFASGAPLEILQPTLRASSTPVKIQVGEVLLFDAHTGHGSVCHAQDRTRVSLDFRVATAGRRPKLSWKQRPLC